MKVSVGLGLAAVLLVAGCGAENEASVAVLGSPAWEAETSQDAIGGTEVPASLNIPAGSTAGLALTLVPRNIGQAFTDALVPNAGDVTTVLVRTHLEGHTTDGHHLSSQTFTFPVTVCNGCASPCQTSECLCDHLGG